MLNRQPLVSIIMPVYNTETYLREAIDSMLRQTYENFELIIVNDGSTDGSQKIIDHYSRIDKRILSVEQPNSGVVAAANYGASLAKGEYVMRTDSDDVSFSNKLKDLIETAVKNPQAVVVSGNIEVIDEDGLYTFRDIVYPFSDDIKRAFYMRNPLPNGATLIKKSAFENVGAYDNVFAEDCHLWVKLYNEGDFAGTGTFVYRWRLNSKGLTLSNNARSIEKEKEYTSLIWKQSPPGYVTRKDILQRSNYYVSEYIKFGLDYKHMFLHDLARLSVHLIKRGYFMQGVRQLLVIASTGRTGLKIVLKRLYLVFEGKINKLRHRSNQHLEDEAVIDQV